MKTNQHLAEHIVKIIAQAERDAQRIAAICRGRAPHDARGAQHDRDTVYISGRDPLEE